MKQLHLVCNAHLDPYWLWEWEEGAAEALSTFRIAADSCEEYEGFVFNHNEVILYEWVEEYDPALFKRIQELVKQGKWHIMGGWYLQPDCNMPSGESFVRQILSGRRYFSTRFGVEPTTAINFDPFGHTRGLAQILAKSGYDSYLHCRPGAGDLSLPDADYAWVGYDGSEVMGHRTLTWYGCIKSGQIEGVLKQYLAEHSERELGLFTWGIGNHGGGPSREDLDAINQIIADNDTFTILHSTPDAFFRQRRELGEKPLRHEADLNAWAPGCYTSQVRIKQKHRELENSLYAVEKMASQASIQNLMAYPEHEFHEATRDLLVAEFHDILPGSSIQACEEAGLRLLEHGLEILSRVRAKAFFALAAGQPKAKEGEIPILAYNHHPFPVEGLFMCEFNLPNAGQDGTFTQIHASMNGHAVPCQVEQEASNLTNDWRKRCVFRATLKPGQMSRFDCTTEVLAGKPAPTLVPKDGRFVFKTGRIEVSINERTGLLERYAVDGVDYLDANAMRLRVIADYEDPWGSDVKHFRDVAGEFKLMSPEQSARLSGVSSVTLPPVRVVEEGPVRTVIEAVFQYGDSFVITTYGLPQDGTELEVHVRVFWNEKNKMLKLAFPVPFNDPRYLGEVAYGRDVLPGAEREVVAQKWVAAASSDKSKALTVINAGCYGSDFVDGEIRLSLLRSPAYSALPCNPALPRVPQDRFTPRIDQGERQFVFWLNGGPCSARMDAIGREAVSHNEAPMLLSLFPSGEGTVPEPGIELSDDVVEMTAFKHAEEGDGYIVRLFEPTGTPRTTTLRVRALGIEQQVNLGAFEIKSLRLDSACGSMCETDLMERPLNAN